MGWGGGRGGTVFSPPTSAPTTDSAKGTQLGAELNFLTPKVLFHRRPTPTRLCSPASTSDATGTRGPTGSVSRAP